MRGVEVIQSGRRGDEPRPDLRRVPHRQGPTRGRTGSRPLGRGIPAEPGEVGRQALRQPGAQSSEARPDGIGTAGREQELGRGQEHQLPHLLDAPLVGRIERTKGVDLVAEELDPDGERGGRREHVHDAAATRKLTSARDLEDRRVAMLEELVEERLKTDPRPGLQRAQALGQVVGGERRLEERLDARDEDLGLPGPPRGQGRHPGGRLIGNELAPLVRE